MTSLPSGDRRDRRTPGALRPSLRQRIAYAIDTSLAGGPAVLIGWLGIVSLVMILVLSLVVWSTGIAPAGEDGSPGFLQIAWMSLLRTLDPGTMGGDAGSRASCSRCSS